MKRILIIFSLLLIPAIAAQSYAADELPDVQLQMRDYDELEIPAGTFIPVINSQEISTRYCSEGFKVKFISSNDLFMYETNIIPKGTAFYGYIEKMNEPVVGTNGSMKIKITKMIFEDGYEQPVQGYIYTTNNNIIGGGMSAPAEWVKVPHVQKRYGTTLQIKPGRRRMQGTDAVVPSGENLLIVLTASAYLTHTLTN